MPLSDAVWLLPVCPVRSNGHLYISGILRIQERLRGQDDLVHRLAILFQPFAKIALGRVLWNIVDVIVAGYLIYLVVRNKKN